LKNIAHKSLKLLVVSLLYLFTIIGYTKDSKISYRSVRLYVEKQVENIWFTDINKNKNLEICIQEANNILLYSSTSDGLYDSKNNMSIPVPSDFLIYDIVEEASGKFFMVGLTNEGVKGFIADSSSQSSVELLYASKTPFRKTNSSNPVRRKMLVDYDNDNNVDIISPIREGVVLLKKKDDKWIGTELKISWDIFHSFWGISMGVPDQIIITYPDCFFYDFNGDGLLDLWIRNDVPPSANNDFKIYLQESGGAISTTPITPFSVDSKKKSKGDYPYSIRPIVTDLNGDNVADVVSSNSRNKIFTLLGSKEKTESNQPSQIIQYSGWLVGFWVVDINNDGHKDLVVAYVDEIDVWSALKILTQRKIDIHAAVYINEKNGNFPSGPNYNQSISVPFFISAINEQVSLKTPYLVTFDADVNGDGFKDLVVKTGSEELSVYNGIADKVFSEKVNCTINTMNTEGFTSDTPRIVDLNGDKIDDLVILHSRSTDNKHVVEILLSSVQK
jgi:hypothetical protein